MFATTHLGLCDHTELQCSDSPRQRICSAIMWMLIFNWNSLDSTLWFVSMFSWNIADWTRVSMGAWRVAVASRGMLPLIVGGVSSDFSGISQWGGGGKSVLLSGWQRRKFAEVPYRFLQILPAGGLQARIGNEEQSEFHRCKFYLHRFLAGFANFVKILKDLVLMWTPCLVTAFST